MSKYVTVKDNRDFSRIYRKGKSFVSPVLVTYVIKNRSANVRYGITTGKKIGNAVKRMSNSAKAESFPMRGGNDVSRFGSDDFCG